MIRYKIKDLEILTGIKAHTLRMWEKRYDLLRPNRTETKIRFYTNQDLVKLLNISILYENGCKISKIAEFSEQEVEEKIQQIYSQKHSCGTDITLLIKSTIELKCDLFNEIITNKIRNDGLESAYQSCITCFLKKITSLWKVDKITSVQKHFVFNLIRQKLIVETGHLAPTEKDYFDAVLFTPEWESQEICLLFYNYMLLKKNYRTLYLGANLPINDLKKTLSETNPKRLVLSMITEKEEEEYKQYLINLIETIKLPVYIGGTLVENLGLPNNQSIFSIQDLID